MNTMAPQHYQKVKKNKGRIFGVYIKFMKKKWGQDGVDACQKDLNLPTTDFIDERWYPNQYGIDMAAWIGEKYGMKAVRDLGFHISTERGVVSYFAWIAGMNKVLDRLLEEM